eukprot:1146139-Pelagomonas_calceolata.AAC.1
MNYAELLWVDRLGMYVRVEAANHLDGLVVSALLECIHACTEGRLNGLGMVADEMHMLLPGLSLVPAAGHHGLVRSRCFSCEESHYLFLDSCLDS